MKRRSEVHAVGSHPCGAESWVRGNRGVASSGGCLRTQGSERPSDSVAARELKEKLTAWSLKVAEYEHQFKVHAWQWEMVPKDIERLVLTMGVRR